jgi:hypothetical protein
MSKGHVWQKAKAVKYDVGKGANAVVGCFKVSMLSQSLFAVWGGGLAQGNPIPVIKQLSQSHHS